MQVLLQARTPKLSTWFAAAVATAPLLLAAPGHAQPAEQTQQTQQSSANAQYTRAIDAIDRKDYVEGRRLLLDLWQKNKTYDVAASLGQCEFKLRNYPAAAQYMSFAIANAPPMEDPEVVERFQRGFAEAKARVGSLRIKGDPVPDRITVDGTPIEITSWPTEIFLSPGKHVIDAELGASASSRNIEISAKGDYEVSFELSAPRSRDPASDPAKQTPQPQPQTSSVPQPPARDSSARRSLTPVWIGSAVALGGLVLGIAETARANNAKDSAAALRTDTASAGSGACISPTTDELQAKCSEQQDAVTRHDSALGWATGGFIVAGAAAAFTLGYLLWPTQKQTTGAPTKRTVAVLPAASPHQLGLSLAGSFQ